MIAAMFGFRPALPDRAPAARPRRPLRVAAALAAIVPLFGCTGIDDQLIAALEPRMAGVFSPRLALSEEVEPLVRIGLHQTWANAPGALIAGQRPLLSEREQRIGLENHTTLPGDNLLILRARYAPWQPVARAQLDGIVARAGGPLPPFERITEANLRSGTDAVGAYFWVEMRMPGDVVCVYALRQLPGAVRLVPQGTRAIEVVLRNCVPGTVDEALAPIRAERLGVATAATSPQGTSRMLSPLAAPQF